MWKNDIYNEEVTSEVKVFSIEDGCPHLWGGKGAAEVNPLTALEDQVETAESHRYSV